MEQIYDLAFYDSNNEDDDDNNTFRDATQAEDGID